MGVNQGCLLSPTLFGLCVDELVEVVNSVAREGLDGWQYIHVILLLLCVCHGYLFIWFDGM